MKKFLFPLVMTLLLPTPLFGYDTSGRWGIGLGTPYICIRYGVNPGVSLEVKGAYTEGIWAAGARVYANINPKDRTVYYLGGEANYCKFDIYEVKGKGYVVGAFFGLELFLTHSLSFSVDVGPYYIRCEDEEFPTLYVKGLDYVANLCIHIYFGKRR